MLFSCQIFPLNLPERNSNLPEAEGGKLQVLGRKKTISIVRVKVGEERCKAMKSYSAKFPKMLLVKKLQIVNLRASFSFSFSFTLILNFGKNNHKTAALEATQNLIIPSVA